MGGTGNRQEEQLALGVKEGTASISMIPCTSVTGPGEVATDGSRIPAAMMSKKPSSNRPTAAMPGVIRRRRRSGSSAAGTGWMEEIGHKRDEMVLRDNVLAGGRVPVSRYPLPVTRSAAGSRQEARCLMAVGGGRWAVSPSNARRRGGGAPPLLLSPGRRLRMAPLPIRTLAARRRRAHERARGRRAGR